MAITDDFPIISSEVAYDFLKGRMSFDVEEFWVLALSSTKLVRNFRMIFRGTVDCCMIHPREIFHFAIESQASSILLAHSHPSGDQLPSSQDIKITKNLKKVSEIMEIPILDHLILTRSSYFSFQDNKTVL